MKIIKGILAEELDGARRRLALYQKELSRLPKGSIISKRIKGGLFHYLAYRNGPRMIFKYQGKLDRKALDKFQALQKQRIQYRGFIRDLKKQIRFLERTLHERKRRKGPA